MGKTSTITLLVITIIAAIYLPELLSDNSTVQTIGKLDSIKDFGLVLGAMILSATFG